MYVFSAPTCAERQQCKNSGKIHKFRHRDFKVGYGSEVASLAFAGLVMIGCGKSSAGAAPGAMGPMPVTVVRIQPSDVGLAREWVARSTAT